MSILKSKSKKPLSLWLSEYAVSHQHPTNKSIHFVCVPIIFLTIVAVLFTISPYLLAVVSIVIMAFYWRLSPSLFINMLIFLLLCIAISASLPVSIWFWISVFVVAWIGQFYGHKLEGAKPSFLEDVQFLLIGPAWVALSIVNRGQLPNT